MLSNIPKTRTFEHFLSKIRLNVRVLEFCIFGFCEISHKVGV